MYEGQWRDDYFHGMGQLRTGMTVYEGQFRKSKKQGHGTLVRTDSSWYEGSFEDNLFEGEGHAVDAGGVYHGQWHRGMMHGKGKFTNACGATYEGDWVRLYWAECTPPTGRNLMTAHCPRRPHAQVRGIREGRGTLRYPAGDVVEGEWKGDRLEGSGKFLLSDGTEYEGGYETGRRQGHGMWRSMVSAHPVAPGE